jgi:hypothetical protein
VIDSNRNPGLPDRANWRIKNVLEMFGPQTSMIGVCPSSPAGMLVSSSHWLAVLFRMRLKTDVTARFSGVRVRSGLPGDRPLGRSAHHLLPRTRRSTVYTL